MSHPHTKTLSFEQIKELVPFRYPFLMIDRVLDYVEGESIVAIKNTTGTEPYFIGHFPNRAVNPGTLTMESMMQASTILASLTFLKDQRITDLDAFNFYLTGIDKVKFRRAVVPGDQLLIEVRLVATGTAAKLVRGKFTGKVTVDGELAMTGSFSAVMPVDS